MQDPITRGWVEVPVPDETATMPAYVARPPAPGTYPNVIVGFEMFGVTSYIRDVTDRIARLGYIAIAPDFYHRHGHSTEPPTADPYPHHRHRRSHHQRPVPGRRG